MRVCIVSEGCYPYVVGGVSSWIHGLIRGFPEVEFVLYGVIASREMRGKFKYDLPHNVREVYECYLMDDDFCGQEHPPELHRTFRLTHEEKAALKTLVMGENIRWEELFQMFCYGDYSLNDLLMGQDFFEITKDYYAKNYPTLVFTDFLWTLRSIYLPLFHTLRHPIPKADIYHCVCTGYPGVIGSMAKSLYGGSLIISEHGIYTREREEELIKAKWVSGIYKDIWIEQFKKMSALAYKSADCVTSLFEKSRGLQMELGCPESKTIVTPNGVDIKRFQNIPQREADDGFINVAALLRVVPIKDVKTLITAYNMAKKRDARLKLWIMGPDDEDPEYAQACRSAIRFLKCKDIVFTGRIDPAEYFGRMDMTVLTSISEGQPLSILEGFAAHLPAVATNVGNCEGLIYGEKDALGPAGYVVPIMNAEKIAEAILELAANAQHRKHMGETGYQRCVLHYQAQHALDPYRTIYEDCANRAKKTKEQRWQV